MIVLADIFKKFLILGIFLNLSGCLKADSETSSFSTQTSLTIKGQVVLTNGSPAPNTQIFTTIDSESRLVTDEQGQFSLSFSSSELATLAAFSPTAKTAFNLYFELVNGSSLKAISTPINSGSSGSMTLDAITLQATAAAAGKILVLGDDGNMTAAPEIIEMYIGRTKISPDAKGNFSISGLPSGQVPVQARINGFADFSETWTLVPGQTTTFEQTFLLFPATGIHGLLQSDKPKTDAETQVKSPYSQSFTVSHSPGAAYIRYHHNKLELTTNELVSWHTIQKTIDYDFRTAGAHTLYYQFTDATQSTFSQIYILDSLLDPLGLSTGFTINDGSGIAKSHNISLKIDVPPAAFRMRVAESEDLLRVADWMLPQPIYNFRINTNDRRDVGSRTIYVQFGDATGTIGPFFTAIVLLDLWPMQNPGVFTINNGAPSTKNRLVKLNINVPVQAYEMQIFEEGANQTTSLGVSANGGASAVAVVQTKNIWLAASSEMYFSFSGPGQKNLYLQFRTIDQIASPVYNQVIRVEPFPIGPENGFLINGGDPFSRSRNLEITLIPPPGSVRFKIAENPTSLFSTPWLSLTPYYVFQSFGSGLKNLYVLYQDIDGNESSIYTQSIYIDPFPQSDFLINGGATVTLSPKLHIELLPPINARYYMIAEGIVPDEEFVEWREIQPDVALIVTGTGAKLVYVRYRSDDGLVSAPVQRTIFYDPFPYGTAGVIINNGAMTTTSDTVNLRIYGEVNLITMRISTEINMLNMMPFSEYREFLTFQLPVENGLHKVYVQFKTASGEVSPVYFSDITKNTPAP